MIMLKARGTLWCILGILFVLSITAAAFAQQDQQSDSVPADSQVKQDTLTEINKTLKELSDNYHKLDKQVGNLNTKVTFLLWAFGLFFTLVVVPALAVLWRILYYWFKNANTVPKVAAGVVDKTQQTSDAFLSKANQMDTAQSDFHLPEE